MFVHMFVILFLFTYLSHILAKSSFICFSYFGDFPICANAQYIATYNGRRTSCDGPTAAAEVSAQQALDGDASVLRRGCATSEEDLVPKQACK